MHSPRLSISFWKSGELRQKLLPLSRTAAALFTHKLHSKVCLQVETQHCFLFWSQTVCVNGRFGWFGRQLRHKTPNYHPTRFHLASDHTVLTKHTQVQADDCKLWGVLTASGLTVVKVTTAVSQDAPQRAEQRKYQLQRHFIFYQNIQMKGWEFQLIPHPAGF